MSNKFVREITKAFQEVKREMRVATAVALTQTAAEARRDLIAETKRVFDNPTPFILKAFKYDPARAKDKRIVARIKIEEDAGKGISGSDILAPHIEGGDRIIKRFEQRLREKGMLGANEYVVPGKGIRLNKYGNVTGATYTQTLSVLGAHTEVGFLANVTAASRRRNKKLPNLFVIKSGTKSHLHPGIYKRIGKKITTLKPIFIFVKKPKYARRFHFFETIQKTYNEKFQKNLEQAIAKYVK